MPAVTAAGFAMPGADTAAATTFAELGATSPLPLSTTMIGVVVSALRSYDEGDIDVIVCCY